MFGINFKTPANEKEIRRYVNIHNSKLLPCDSLKQLNSAKSVFYKYAKEKKISLSFFDPRFGGDRLQYLAPESDLAACVAIGISRPKQNSGPKFILIDYFKDMKRPFLDRVFEGIQNMVEGDIRTPIEKEKANTIAKLIKIGKIKA